ncbi:MAG: hypothetical protein HW416_3589, partial [Chloroflexi bacterium]|nr:hypothetical protein [Chloroflexota bacterium]
MSNEVRVLVGDDRGGLTLLQSHDSGQSWGDPEVVLPDVEPCAFHQRPDGTVYVGTRGEGLYCSRDGLKNWEHLDTPAGAKRIRSFYSAGDRMLVGAEPATVFARSDNGHWEQLGDMWTAPGSRQWAYPV